LTVRFTRQANNQLGAILEYVRDRNPQSAARLAAAIDRACEQIVAHPDLGRNQDVEGVRRRVVQSGRYLVYYAVSNEDRAIIILAISHPARQRPYNDA